MQITVFGAAGKVGRQVVELALTREYTVVAFVHKNNPFADQPNLIVKQGDVYDGKSVVAALENSQAVISTLGSWGTPTKDVLTKAMQAIIPAMGKQKIRRIITLTGSGATEPGKPVGRSVELLLKLLAPFPAGKVFRDGMEHMRLLAVSDLDWTTIRSPIMLGSRTSSYQLKLRTVGPFATISRRAVATSLVDQLELTDFIRQAPTIYRSPHSSFGHLPKV